MYTVYIQGKSLFKNHSFRTRYFLLHIQKLLQIYKQTISTPKKDTNKNISFLIALKKISP